MSVKTLVRQACRQLGFREESPARPATAGMSMRAGLARCAERGMPVRTVIDVGASNGSWTRLARESYPDAGYLLIEAQQAHEEALRALVNECADSEYVLTAAGHRNGEIYFDARDLFGGVASDVPLECECTSVPVRTIDSLVAERGLSPPFMLKLDTHGFEVPIFDGAAETLKATELVVVEAYNFVLAPGSLRFHELCGFMEGRGLRCIDMCDVSRRPKDHSLWQMDLFFARAGRPEFESNEYD